MKSAPSANAPVHLVYGNESFLKQRAVEKLTRSILGDPEKNAFGNLSRFEGEDATLADVLDELRTFSLLGDRRLVVVEDADDFISGHREGLEAYCKSPSSTGVLVLICKSSSSNTRLHKAVAALGGCIPCETPKYQALSEWIVAQARDAYGKRIETEAAALLRENCDDSLSALDSEISKLATYAGTRPMITVEDVQALVGHHRTEIVFQVTDAMADGNAAEALARWEQVVATDRSASHRALGGLAWGIRKLLELRYAVEGGASPTALTRQARMPPDVLARRLRACTSKSLEAQLQDLLQADLDSKTGLGEVETAVEKFIVKYSVKPQTARSRAR